MQSTRKSGLRDIWFCRYMCIYLYKHTEDFIHTYTDMPQAVRICESHNSNPSNLYGDLWNFRRCALTCNGTALSWVQWVWKDKIKYKWQARFPQYYRSNSQLPFNMPEFSQNIYIYILKYVINQFFNCHFSCHLKEK